MSIQILLADDHKIVRDGLRSLIEKHPGMQVVGEAEDGRGAIDLVRELDPDVVVIDVSMPGLNGIEAARQITAESPQTKIIALSMHSDKRFVAEMLSAGASGYLLKDSAFDELAQAVRTVMNNRTYLSPTIADVVVKDYVGQLFPNESSAYHLLTAREREVLQLLAEGKSTKEIGVALHVSPKTVETHRRNIVEKLEIDSVAELTKYAIREGLTSLEH